MNPDDYTKSLEQLLIFMCQTYDDTQKTLLNLYQTDGNEAAFKVPTIQGTGQTIGIAQLSKLTPETPTHGFADIARHINQRNEGTI